MIAQSFLSAAALAVTIAIWRQPGDEYAFAHMHAVELVQAALRQGADGEPELSETPELAAFRRARPRVKIAVTKDRAAIRGSSPELVSALQTAGSPLFANATFAFTEGPLTGSHVVATAVASRFGQVVIVAADNSLRSADLPALAAHMGSYLWRVMLVVIAGSAVLTPYVVARAIAPLKAASAEAATIDMRSRGVRLPESDGAPTELVPLLKSINSALDRLDEGFGRQQLYAAQAAHELRTPLAVLAARIDSLGGHPKADGLRSDLKRMRELVDQLLQIARLERGDVLLDEPLDLVALARNVVADLAPVAFADGRRLALRPAAAELRIRGGRQVLESAIANLVRNALQVEPAGGTVVVAVGPDPEISVIDHGPGVAPADWELIFEPFWRRGEDRTGAGLGLAIVREAAQAHGATASVEETLGGGATFRFRFGASSDA